MRVACAYDEEKEEMEGERERKRKINMYMRTIVDNLLLRCQTCSPSGFLCNSRSIELYYVHIKNISLIVKFYIFNHTFYMQIPFLFPLLCRLTAEDVAVPIYFRLLCQDKSARRDRERFTRRKSEPRGSHVRALPYAQVV